MQDFLQLLRTARQEIDAQLARLIHDLERGVPLLNASGLPQTTETLCRVLDLLGPYMEHYPALSAQEVWERWRDNTLDQHYPLDKGTR